MEEYFYIDDSEQQQGPVNGNDFRKYGVTEKTLVWRAGMENWQPAGSVPELSVIFVQPPAPPISSSSSAKPENEASRERPQAHTDFVGKPDNYLIWAILTTILCCLPLGIVAIVYSSKVDTLWSAGDKIGAKEAADKSKLFSILSLVIGIVSITIGFFMGVASAFFGI